jgi:hypothetical protein
VSAGFIRSFRPWPERTPALGFGPPRLAARMGTLPRRPERRVHPQFSSSDPADLVTASRAGGRVARTGGKPEYRLRVNRARIRLAEDLGFGSVGRTFAAWTGELSKSVGAHRLQESSSSRASDPFRGSRQRANTVEGLHADDPSSRNRSVVGFAPIRTSFGTWSPQGTFPGLTGRLTRTLAPRFPRPPGLAG